MAKATTTEKAAPAPKAVKDTKPKPGTPHTLAAKYGIPLGETGRFAPGGDAKLKSLLIKAVLAGGVKGKAAAADLEKVGWGKYVPSAERIEAAKAKGTKAAKVAKVVSNEAEAKNVVEEVDSTTPGDEPVDPDLGF